MSKWALVWLVSGCLLLLFVGCEDDITYQGGDGGGGQGAQGGSGAHGGTGGTGPSCTVADKVDVLLAIDNSRSMADKQSVLRMAVVDLVERLVNPWCVWADSGLLYPTITQPANPKQPCPQRGTVRQFQPLDDIHIGIVTSSLGGHGSDACDPASDLSNDDRGHLVARGDGVQTYQDQGFLWWHPDLLSDTEAQINAQKADLIDNLTKMVVGVGEVGCGYEAQLESWYRFLVQPDPWESVELQASQAVLIGDDLVLLEQRRAFLRPDSLLVIVMLTDENDCSIKDGGVNWIVAQQQMGGGYFRMPRPTAECAVDPYDPCCYSCGQTNPPSECDTSDDDCSSALAPEEDHINMRCYDQKRRFGIDFLYAIDRYADGLTAPTVPDRNGNPQANPIFTDLDPSDGNDEIRTAGSVFLAGIVGVPWQDIARRDDGGRPDLVSGLDADRNPVGSFQSASELVTNGTWDMILGDPRHYHTDPGARPTDPLLWESIGPRSGVHPLTGEPIGLPPSCNQIAGHEYAYHVTEAIPNGDLQFSCLFRLDEPRDCRGPTPPTACDCTDSDNDLPLCSDMHCSGVFGQVQYWAKAYPPIRQLEVLRALGHRGVVTSSAPAELGDQGSPIYGYRPAVSAIVEHLGNCLPQ